MWHAATLLREHRGDGHVAALVAAGIGGRESHVLHGLATGTPDEVYVAARHLLDDERGRLVGGLADRGLVDPATSTLTSEGRALKAALEERTDVLAAVAYEGLTDEELDELESALLPLARAVVAGGDLPLSSPMGLDLSGLAG